MVDDLDQGGVEPVAQPGLSPPAPVPAAPANKWGSALVIAGAAPVASGEKRGIVVCEVRGDDGAIPTPPPKYPAGADFYLRIDPECDFGSAAPVLTMGDNVEQGLLWGFSSTPGILHVGPSHPAFAAANLAAQQGATVIEVQGLSAKWKQALQPWFDKLPTDPRYPSDAVIKLT